MDVKAIEEMRIRAEQNEAKAREILQVLNGLTIAEARKLLQDVQELLDSQIVAVSQG